MVWVFDVPVVDHQLRHSCPNTRQFNDLALNNSYSHPSLTSKMDPDSSFSQHDQNDESSLWDSPVKPGQGKIQSTYEQQEAREQELRRELESVRRVNEAIEGVIESLRKAKDNIKVASCRLNPKCLDANGIDRPSTPPSAPHQHCSIPGPAFCLRLSIINVSSLIPTGTVRAKIFPTSNEKPARSSEQQNDGKLKNKSEDLPQLSGLKRKRSARLT